MEWYRKTETRGVRETERPVSFIPKGALTHHLRSKRWYAYGIVRSPRGMRLLRKPYGQCHILAVCCHCPRSYRNHNRRAIVWWGTACTPPCANCLRKPATGSFVADMDGSAPSIFFLRKRNKNRGRKDGENEWRSTTWKQRL